MKITLIFVSFHPLSTISSILNKCKVKLGICIQLKFNCVQYTKLCFKLVIMAEPQNSLLLSHAESPQLRQISHVKLKIFYSMSNPIILCCRVLHRRYDLSVERQSYCWVTRIVFNILLIIISNTKIKNSQIALLTNHPF